MEPGGYQDCGEMAGYVDNCAYSYAHSYPEVMSRVLSRKYSLIEDWLNGNKLVINPCKTHLMVMGPKKFSARRSQFSIQDKLDPSPSSLLSQRRCLEVFYTNPLCGILI